jgi:hypothetical protein
MLELLAQVSATLAASGIPHALIGAGALAVHGISRATFDVDLLTTDPRALEPTLWAPLQAGGVAVDVRRGDDADPLAGVVRLARPDQRDVDVVVGRPGWQARIPERAAAVTLGGRTIPVATPPDLVLLKLYAGSARDAWDVDQLLDASADERALRAAVLAQLGALPPEAAALWKAILARRP